MVAIILLINIRKTTGCDLIPGKLIKEGADFLCKPIQSLINKCIDTCTFPNALKLADVVPIFKKNDMLNKMNYRPGLGSSTVDQVLKYTKYPNYIPSTSTGQVLIF